MNLCSVIAINLPTVKFRRNSSAASTPYQPPAERSIWLHRHDVITERDGMPILFLRSDRRIAIYRQKEEK
jgi:hypothetical protein